MDISTSINILSFLIFVLIAVLVSKKARKVVNEIMQFIFKAARFIFIGIAFLAILGIIILIVRGIISLIVWGWKQSHIIFPRVWSLSEIIGVMAGLFILGLFYFLFQTPKFNRVVFDKDNKIKNKIIKELYVLIGVAVSGAIIAVLPSTSNSFEVVKYKLGVGILLFGYPVYLIIRSILWAIKTLRKNE